MTQKYSEVNPNGYVTRSLFTDDPEHGVAPLCRLLPDSPPEGMEPPYIECKRVEPVPADATEIAYVITKMTADDIKKLKLKQFCTIADLLVDQLRSSYPEVEVLSWPRQETEARAFIGSGLEDDAPLLKGIAVRRGIDLADLANRVIAKANAYASFTGNIFGERQRLEDLMDTIQYDPETLTELKVVAWSLVQ